MSAWETPETGPLEELEKLEELQTAELVEGFVGSDPLHVEVVVDAAKLFRACDMQMSEFYRVLTAIEWFTRSMRAPDADE